MHPPGVHRPPSHKLATTRYRPRLVRRERAPGVWEIVIYAGRDPATGKDRRVSRTYRGNDTGAKRYEAKLARTIAAERTPSAIRIADLLDRWVEVARLEPSTRASQTEPAIRRHLNPRIGHIPIDALTVEHVDAFYLALERGGDFITVTGTDGTPYQIVAAPLSASSVRRIHGILHAALALAVKWSWIERNVASHAAKPQVPSPDPRPPDVDVVRGLLAVASETDPEFAVFLRLAASTGGRPGETLALRVDTVDLDRGVVHRRLAVKRASGREYVGATKTGARHQVAIGAATIDALRRHLDRMRDRAAYFETTFRPDGYLFTDTLDGAKPWRADSLSKRFARLRSHVDGAEKLELRSLRHWLATTLLDEGVPLKTVSGRLSHARTATTSEFYAAWVPPTDQHAADVADRLLDG